MPALDDFSSDYDFPETPAARRTYLIASVQRSGSYLLGLLLAQTGQLGVPLEYFHPGRMKEAKANWGVSDERDVLSHWFERRTSPCGWFGVKAHWRQFAPIAARPDLMQMLAVEKYVRIRRHDRIGQAVSLAMAHQTHAWSSFNTEKAQPQYNRAAIDAAMLRIEEDSNGWEHFFASNGVEPIEVFYEDLVQHPSLIVSDIAVKFGVAAMSDRKLVPIPERQATEVNEAWKLRYMSEVRGS